LPRTIALHDARVLTQEFTAKIGVVAEEADESPYWLGLAVRHLYGDRAAAKKLSEEALELTKIFARSASTARSKHRKNPNRRCRFCNHPITP